MKRGQKSVGYYVRGVIDRVSRKVYPRYKRRNVTLFRYTSALGDALFLTTLAREVKKRNPAAHIHVITGLPEIFERNPDVNRITLHEPDKKFGIGKYLVRYEHRFPWKQHLLQECARSVDIFDNIELKTYIFPTDDDRSWAKKVVPDGSTKPVLICRTAGPRTDKKNWPESYWQQLLPELLALHPVIEVGSAGAGIAPVSTNYTDLRGKTTLHQLTALMERAGLLICPVTGLLHLASAVDLPVVCIAGGSEPALATRYKNTHHLVNRPHCADCYEQGPCVSNFECLHAIRPADVLAKVNAVADETKNRTRN